MPVQLNLKRRSGDLLVERGIVTRDQLDQALATQMSEPEAIRRRLGAILVDEMGIDRHTVMKTISDFYAFRDVTNVPDILSDERINSIKKILETLPNEVVDELAHRKTIPFRVERNNLIIAAADPTDPVIITLADKLGFKNFEITYCKLETLEVILSRVYEKKNEFLDLLEEIEMDDTNI